MAEEAYNPLVIEHFTNPRNAGDLPNADAVGVQLQNLSALAPLAESDIKQVQAALESARESLRSERMGFIKLQNDSLSKI